MSWRALLLPFSLLYGAVVIIRNWFFDIGLLPVQKVLASVISVGNISAGGVGKTPFVQFLVERLKKTGKVAVISRGYRRKSRGYLVVSNGKQRCAESENAGDEASQMAERLDDVVVIVDEERVRGANHAVKDFHVNTILLDDGFQHRYLHRDMDIVILTAQEVLSGDFLLPAGNRREPISAIARANVIGISGCTTNDVFDRAKRELVRRFPKPLFGFRLQPRGFRIARTREREDINGKSAIAFSGIGNPAAFEQTLVSVGIHVMKNIAFPDHHWYSQGELDKLVDTWRAMKADVIVTTEKDVARLGNVGRSFVSMNPVFFLEVEPEIIAGQEMLEQQLQGF